MEEIIANVSWIGVIVGAVAAFILGYFWYSPMLFGKKWAEGVGVELGKASSKPMMALVMQAIGLLLLSWFVGVTAVDSKLLTFILVILAFVVLQASNVVFAQKPLSVARINGGYWIAASVVMFISQMIF